MTTKQIPALTFLNSPRQSKEVISLETVLTAIPTSVSTQNQIGPILIDSNKPFLIFCIFTGSLYHVLVWIKLSKYLMKGTVLPTVSSSPPLYICESHLFLLESAGLSWWRQKHIGGSLSRGRTFVYLSSKIICEWHSGTDSQSSSELWGLLETMLERQTGSGRMCCRAWKVGYFNKVSVVLKSCMNCLILTHSDHRPSRLVPSTLTSSGS